MRCVPCGNGNCSISTSMWCSHKLCTDIVAPLSLRYRARPKPLNRSRRVIIAAPRTSKNVKRCRIHGSRGRRRRVCGERETSGCTIEWRALSMKTRLISDAPHFLAPDLISGRGPAIFAGAIGPPILFRFWDLPVIREEERLGWMLEGWSNRKE